jgi:hypothetical protein
LSGDFSQIPTFSLCKADVYQREAPIGDSLFMRAAGAVSPKYAQTPRILTHPVNDREFDHQSQYSNWIVKIREIGWQKTEVR